MQWQFKSEFNKEPPTRVTITRIRDKFEADGTVQDVHKNRSGRPRTSTNSKKEERLLEMFQRSPRKYIIASGTWNDVKKMHTFPKDYVE